ncbi:hypothetical protein LK07_08780 [Streptomyces pluripotens]|uniref:Ricin B lectin domain-containing protein n=1 Tax=Streptomyces pluripotens TaxID=1355015 RepID=A0A221NW22_9ACTN|nr:MULTISPECIES: RICIN domain-containing protein [Streptomyces]ARP69857.1 hypothetical protein LK06_007675 [Streptomyces pluripotens]ASN24114.1 hypothetical protein LK07_08780 [Streptomyces pluripotens]KIE24019.1 hypothetical protein LK08_25900 [Streptomyces sp. MUSC 125]MCH0555634.1 RICIN domain-containing protein [Streptomyces sp. MUM 16J]
MRRRTAALLTPALAFAGALALPATAHAEAPGNCVTSHNGPLALADCTGVAKGTTWQARAVCMHVISGQPLDYWRNGTLATGNGRSVVYCNRGDYATKTIRTVTLSVAGKQGRLVGYGGKCVDIQHAKASNSTAVQLYHCNGTAAQWWTLGNDHTVRGLGYCLNVEWGRRANGTHVEIYKCVPGATGEQWIPQPNGSLKNVLTGKCLDDLGFNTKDRTRLGIWDCNGLANQKWTLTQ